MHARGAYLSFDLNQTVLQVVQTRAHRSKFRTYIALRRDRAHSHAPRNPLCHQSRLIFHSYKRSTRSTTPTIAESIAAPAFPVAAVDALQPSCTISTVSPTPASTESSASTE